MVGFRPTFAGLATLPDGAPLPVEAIYTLVDDTLRVKFDQLLKGATLDDTNWTVRILNFAVTVLSATASGRFVTVPCSKVTGAPQPNDFSYSAVAGDVQSRLSVPAAAIVDFPMSVV